MISQELIDKLNQMRTPFSIDSMIRTPSHNASVGGAPHSAHVSGQAADLIFDNGLDMVKAAYEALSIGFMGIEVDAGNQHLHLDVMGRVWRVWKVGKDEHPLWDWLQQYYPELKPEGP